MNDFVQLVRQHPLFRFVLALGTGIFLSRYLPMTFSPWAWSICIVACVAIGWVLCYRKNRSSVFGLSIVAGLSLLLVGAMLYQFRWQQVHVEWSESTQLYKIQVLDEGTPKAKTTAYEVEVQGKKVLMYVANDSDKWHTGDLIMCRTTIEKPRHSGNPYQFDYERYLKYHYVTGTAYIKKGSWKRVGRVYDLSWKQKALHLRNVTQCYAKKMHVTDTSKALVEALLLGYKADLGDEVKSSFSKAGVSHVLALSGLHVGVIWGILHFLFGFLGKSKPIRILTATTTIVSLWAFAFVTGLLPSVVRAVIMCCMMEVLYVMNRRKLSLNTLCAAAFFMLIYNPFYLFDVSFQLSFMAMFFIIMLYAPIYNKLQKITSRLSWLWSLIAVSIAAQVGTLPLVLYYFYECSVYFMVGNLLITPLVPIVIYTSVVALLLTMMQWQVAWVYGFLDYLLNTLVNLTDYIATLPGAVMRVNYLSEVDVWMLYVLIIAIILMFSVTKRYVTLYTLAWGTLCVCIFNIEHKTQPMPRGIQFYNLRGGTAIHLMQESGKSYLFTRGNQNIEEQMDRIEADYWNRMKWNNPIRITENDRYDDVYVRHGICQWGDKRIAIIYDNSWKKLETKCPLMVDYLYLCATFKGSMDELAHLFSPQLVVMEASISFDKKEQYVTSCKQQGWEVRDLYQTGAFFVKE